MGDLQLQPGERELAAVRLQGLFIFSSFGRFLAAVFTLGLSAYLIRSSHTLTITNRRLVLRQGILTKTVVEMELGRVAQVEVTSSWIDRLFGIGRLKIIALDQFTFEMSPIEGPDRVKDIVMAAAAEARRSLPGAAGTPAAEQRDEPLSALERLGKLRQTGALTEAEFEAKKRELLAKI